MPNRSFAVTCIRCPMGCRVAIDATDGEYVFSGNKCPNGAEFAKTEMTAPLRSLTTTIRTAFPDMPVLPVKTNGEVSKDMLTKIVWELSKLVITKRIGIGETIVANILDTGCDIIATSDMLREERTC